MTIPFLDLQQQYASIKKEIDSAVENVLKKQIFIAGDECREFEKEFSHYLGISHTITVNSGTDALILALRALGIGKGDEVITQPNSFIATTLAITEVGATPVFVDINPDTYQIDEALIEKKITKKTKAILPVHLYGAPCEIEKIMYIASKHNLYVIEDAAQGIGATYKNQKVGTFGDVGCLSFYPGKNLGAYGDGGALVTNNEDLADKLRKLSNYGQTKKYHHVSIGINTRLDELQAAILRVKLSHIDEWNKKRREHSQLYNSLLKVKTQNIVANGMSNYHIFLIETKKRDELQEKLAEKGIGTLIHYPIPIHKQKCYKNRSFANESYPHTEHAARHILSLPMYTELDDRTIEKITETINDCV